MTENIVSTTKNHIITLTLNSPQTRNALSTQLMTALRNALREIGDDSSIHAIIIAAEGPMFSSGHDLKEVRGAAHARQQEIFDLCTDLMLTIQRIPQPVIARVHGLATAAGAQLATTCDLVVAAKSSSFATPGVKIGLFCSTPGVAIARALPTKQAMRMLLTGDPVSADRALELGMVSDVVDDDLLISATNELAEKVAQASSATVAIGKEAFYRQINMPIEDAYREMSDTMANNAVIDDAQEGIDAFLSKRSPEWKGR